MILLAVLDMCFLEVHCYLKLILTSSIKGKKELQSFINGQTITEMDQSWAHIQNMIIDV